MSKFYSSRLAFGLCVALSLMLSLLVVDAIAAEGMKAAEALKILRADYQPLHA